MKTIAALALLGLFTSATAFAHGTHDPGEIPTFAEAELLHEQRLWENAAEAFDHYLAVNPFHGGAWLRLGEARYQVGDYAQAIDAYEHAVELGVGPLAASYNIACCHALLGQSEPAVAWLERALNDGFRDFDLLAKDADLASIRSDPEFQALVATPDVSGLSRVEGWRFDVDFVLREIEERHVQPDHRVSREGLRAAAAKLKEAIPDLTDAAAAVELRRLVARVGDGHTWLTLPGERTHHEHAEVRLAPFRHLPIRVVDFADGWYIESATPEYASAVGHRIARIGSNRTEEVYEALAPLCSSDNAMTIRDRLPRLLSNVDVLEVTGLIDDPQRVGFLVEDANGNRLAHEFAPMEGDTNDRQAWVKMRNDGEPPLWLSRPDDWHWFEPLDDGVVYVNFSAVRDQGDETVEGFCAELFAYLDENDVRRLIVDLRRNGGGNNFLNRHLVRGIVEREDLNRRGRLFTIIGPQTFSAAMCLAVDLERQTEMIFVGEPTGSSPNFIGETSISRLPWSGLALSVSTLFWQNSYALDQRLWIPAEIPAPLTARAYRENRDPALEAILGYMHPGSP